MIAYHCREIILTERGRKSGEAVTKKSVLKIPLRGARRESPAGKSAGRTVLRVVSTVAGPSAS